MADDTPSPLNNVITIDDERIKSPPRPVVRGCDFSSALSSLKAAARTVRFGLCSPTAVHLAVCPSSGRSIGQPNKVDVVGNMLRQE